MSLKTNQQHQATLRRNIAYTVRIKKTAILFSTAQEWSDTKSYTYNTNFSSDQATEAIIPLNVELNVFCPPNIFGSTLQNMIQIFKKCNYEQK